MKMRALCVFHDYGAHFLRRFLKPGFQHCFLAVASDDCWIVLDSKMGAPDICVVAESRFDLAGFYRDEGFTVIETVMKGSGEAAVISQFFPLMLATCVGMTKRLLGFSAPGIFTPWQLYRRLTAVSISHQIKEIDMTEETHTQFYDENPDRRARGRETVARFRPLITAEESSSNNRLVDALMTKSDPGDLPELLAKTVQDHGEDAVCEISDLFDKTSRRSPPMATKLLSGFKSKLAGAPETLKPLRFRGLAATPVLAPADGPTKLDDMLAGMEDLVETDAGRIPLPVPKSMPALKKTSDNGLGGPSNRSTPPNSNGAMKVAMNTKPSPGVGSPRATAAAPSNPPPPKMSGADKLFNKYRQNLKHWEGGFANRPTDRGGPTQKGMSQKALDPLRKKDKWKHLPSQSKNLTEAQINRVFRKEYFDRLHIDKLENVPGLSGSAPKLAEQIFDIGILHGIDDAGIWLQKSLDNVLGTDLRVSTKKGQRFYDGIIGPATRKAVERAVRLGKAVQVNNAIVDRRLKWMKASPDLKNNTGWTIRAEAFRMLPMSP